MFSHFGMNNCFLDMKLQAFGMNEFRVDNIHEK